MDNTLVAFLVVFKGLRGYIGTVRCYVKSLRLFGRSRVVRNTTHEMIGLFWEKSWTRKLLVSHDDELETGRVYDKLWQGMSPVHVRHV